MAEANSVQERRDVQIHRVHKVNFFPKQSRFQLHFISFLLGLHEYESTYKVGVRSFFYVSSAFFDFVLSVQSGKHPVRCTELNRDDKRNRALLPYWKQPLCHWINASMVS